MIMSNQQFNALNFSSGLSDCTLKEKMESFGLKKLRHFRN